MNKPSSTSPTPFPLALPLAAILTTSLGLTAAALSLKWGPAPPPGDALQSSWLYVNIMLTLTWLVLWPAFALARPNPRCLLTDLVSLIVAAIPSLGLSAFLSNVPLSALPPLLALQLATALLSLGTVSQARTRPSLAPLLATLLSAIALITPILAYLWSEFLPRAANPWPYFSPLLQVAQATASSPHLSYIPPTIYLLSGFALHFTRQRPPRPTDSGQRATDN